MPDRMRLRLPPRLHRAPLALLAGPFAAGIWLEDRLVLGRAGLLAAAAVALALRLVARSQWKRVVFEVALGTALGAGALAARFEAPVAASVEGVAVALRILTPPEPGPAGCRALAFVHGEHPGRALLELPPRGCELLPGALALARVRTLGLRPATNPGGGSPERHWARYGIHARAVANELLEPVLPEPRSFAARAEHLRRRLAAALDPPEARTPTGALLRALVVGDRAGLPPEVERAFERSGTAHLLAVSGLNVAFVFALTQICVRWGLRLLPGLAVARRARAAALVAGLVAAGAYTAVSGLGIPALRAAAMAAAAAVGVLGGRSHAAWNALAAATLLLLALEPAGLFEVSFWLSFLAVAGILLWRPGGTALERLVGCTLGASLAVAPVAAALALAWPVGGLFANALAVPWFAIVVPLALLAALAGLLAAPLHALLLPIAKACAAIGVSVLQALESPDLFAGLPDPRPCALALGVGFLLARQLAPSRWRRSAAVLAVLGAAAGVHALLARQGHADPVPDSVLFLDVGHGDAALVRSGAHAWLVDAGPRVGRFDAGRSVVRPALRAEGVTRLDVLVVTHADLDHIGGAASVVEGMNVGEIWMGIAAHGSSAAEPLRRAAARRRVPIRLVGAGDSARLGGLQVRALWPPRSRRFEDSNAQSLVLRFDGRSGCALLGGDAPGYVERELAPGLRPCALLKLSHHGSRSSSDPEWLRALSPEVAIASAGRRTRGPLPHPEVRMRLRALGASVYETRRYGAVRVALARPGPLVDPFLVKPLP